MFGSTDWPEQFSPHEWRGRQSRSQTDGRAFFPRLPDGALVRTLRRRPLRSARLQAELQLHHRVDPQGPVRVGGPSADHPAESVHDRRARQEVTRTGVAASASISGAPRSRWCQRLPPRRTPSGPTISVAELYDRAYTDITVRNAEWHWVADRATHARAELGQQLRVLEIGCGNGALLRELDGRGGASTLASGWTAPPACWPGHGSAAATTPACGSSRSTGRRWTFPTTTSTW